MAPFGVFAKIAQVFAKEGFDTIFALGKYFLLVIVVLLMHALIVYPAMLKLFTGLNPIIEQRVDFLLTFYAVKPVKIVRDNINENLISFRLHF